MKFRKKPVIIEAEQWFPGKLIEGVTQVDPKLVFSAIGNHYYIECRTPNDWKRADAWLPVDPKADDGVTGQVLPFVFWELNSGNEELAVPTNEFVKTYMSYYGWPKLPDSYGVIETLEGRMSVSSGDWIITGVKGERYSCKPDIFEETYELVDHII